MLSLSAVWSIRRQFSGVPSRWHRSVFTLGFVIAATCTSFFLTQCLLLTSFKTFHRILLQIPPTQNLQPPQAYSSSCSGEIPSVRSKVLLLQISNMQQFEFHSICQMEQRIVHIPAITSHVEAGKTAEANLLLSHINKRCL